MQSPSILCHSLTHEGTSNAMLGEMSHSAWVLNILLDAEQPPTSVMSTLPQG